MLGVLERAISLTTHIFAHLDVLNWATDAILTVAGMILVLYTVIDCRSFLLASIPTVRNSFLKQSKTASCLFNIPLGVICLSVWSQLAWAVRVRTKVLLRLHVLCLGVEPDLCLLPIANAVVWNRLQAWVWWSWAHRVLVVHIARIPANVLLSRG